MNVLLTKKFAASDIQYMKERLSPDVCLIEPAEFNEAGVLEQLQNAEVLLGGLLSEAVVSNAIHLRFAQIPWTGTDNLNFEMLQKHDLTVCNSHSNALVVAEHAVALAFALAKKVPYHDAQMRCGNWNRVSSEGNKVSPFSTSLMNRRITFVGYGAIAQAVHRLLSSFNPTVSAVTFSGVAKDGQSDVSMYKSADIEAAVSEADFVYVCAPLTSESRGMVSQSVFEAMPDHAYLVNVSRGLLVDEAALFHALSNHSIAGAAIDTWYSNPKPGRTENYPSDSFEFQLLDNLVMSPHRAGYIDSGFPHLDDAIENINRSAAGKELLNVVSKANTY